MMGVLKQYLSVPDANKRSSNCLICESLLENAPRQRTLVMGIFDSATLLEHVSETVQRKIARTIQCGCQKRARVNTGPDR